jgi:hypothetical protein
LGKEEYKLSPEGSKYWTRPFFLVVCYKYYLVLRVVCTSINISQYKIQVHQEDEISNKTMFKFNAGLQLLLALIIGTSSVILIQGFTLVPIVSSSRCMQQQQQQQQHKLLNDNNDAVVVKYNTPRIVATTRTNSILSSRKPNAGLDGTGTRGPIIFSIVLLGTIWLFSIPPEFRRAHICTAERCIVNRAACSDCQTVEEIKDGIIQYYKNGGGIQFDFSIDPTTIEKNKEFIKAVGL